MAIDYEVVFLWTSAGYDILWSAAGWSQFVRFKYNDSTWIAISLVIALEAKGWISEILGIV